MKIAVLGGGTAGYIAAAHVTHKLPDAQLLHLYDSSIPTIGVGEGTTPRFPMWLKEIAGLEFADLASRCNVTLKKGVRFEGWGREGTTFFNRFQPSTLIGFHIDAKEIVQVIAEHVRAQQMDHFVESLICTDEGVSLQLRGGESIECDYVFDARGFPRHEIDEALPDSDILSFDWIPTNRARLRWLAPDSRTTESRAVARDHGWIFQLPLRDRINCGYVFNSAISTDKEVDADFAEFLAGEGVDEWEERGALNFPNFMRRTPSDGRVFRIGNTASFIEPLEATAIGTAIVQVRAATDLIATQGSGLGSGPNGRRGIRPELVGDYNQTMTRYTLRNSLFVAWHYNCGSTCDSPFWRHAAQLLTRTARESSRESAWGADVRRELQAMDEYIDSARHLPCGLLAACDNQDQWNRDVFPLMTQYLPFGNFSELNFAQVGQGLGYYRPQSAPGVAASS